MNRHLSLVESDFEQLEKMVLPRFPFCYLTFKCQKQDLVFEVKDISYSGMQLGLKNGDITLKPQEEIQGSLHWQGKNCDILGTVKWQREKRVGVEFVFQNKHENEMTKFLDLNAVAPLMKPLHKMEHGIEVPSNLKYWLRADGPFEFFGWSHSNGEVSKFQIIIMENFIEWEDGKGLKSGRVMSKRDIDTPLLSEDEFVFKIDSHIDMDKLFLAQKLLDKIDQEKLPQEYLDFLEMKLRA